MDISKMLHLIWDIVVLPIKRIIGIIGGRRDENNLASVFMAMSKTSECVNSLDDVLACRFMGYDGLDRLELSNFLMRSPLRISGLLHGKRRASLGFAE